MRLLVWNCGGALQRKIEVVHELDPDVALLVESYAPERIPQLGISSAAWCGRLSYKGLGVFGFGNWTVEQSFPYDPNLEYVLPTVVTGPNGITIDLIAIWASNHRAASHYPESRRIPQAHVMLDKIPIDARDRPTIVAGDFNHGASFDNPPWKTTFGDMAAALQAVGLRSLYHEQTGEDFGHESAPTHWWRERKEDGPTYHIDYVWTSAELGRSAELRVGTFAESVEQGRSDHAWMIADFDIG